jgi:hypothetical protein
MPLLAAVLRMCIAAGMKHGLCGNILPDAEGLSAEVDL